MIIWRRLTGFCKIAIFWVVMGLSKDFTVGGPKYRFHNKHLKAS